MREDTMWVEKLDVEIVMIDPYNFDARHEAILNYVDQELRSKNLPPTNKCVPIAIGASAGILRIKGKYPARAFRLPPLTDPAKYLNLMIKTATSTASQNPIWQYNPSKAEPIWEDDLQVRNAKMLSTYLTNPDLQRASPLILLEGPPGTGKTMVVDYVLSQSLEKFKIFKHQTLSRSYIGETARAIMEMTAEAIEHKPAIILLEEADATFLSRELDGECSGSSKHHVEEVVPTLLQCIDRMAREDGVYMIATTNMNPDDRTVIDPAILSRVGMRLNFPTPPEDSIQKVMKKLSEKNGIQYEMLQLALAEVIGKRKPTYRDLYTAIARAKLMKLAGIELTGKENKVKPKPLPYIQ